MNNVNFGLLAVTTLVFVATGCSFERPAKNPSLTIKLEDHQAPKLLLASPQELWESATMLATTPSTISDFSCFTVNVTGQGINPSVNMVGCTLSSDPSGGGFGAVARPVNRGTPIELDVTGGPSRRVDVYGVFPPTNECQATGASGGGDNSQGYFVGTQTLDLGDSKEITIGTSYAGGAGNITCTNKSGNHQQSLASFGNGTEGDIVISANANASTFAMSNSRTMAAINQVVNVDGAGTTFSVNYSFVAADFGVNDEIMWMVMSSTGGLASNCSSASELAPGKFGFGVVNSINYGAKTITVAAPIVPTPGAILNANLVGASPFCKMQIMRVPNFNNLTLSAGGPISITPDAYNAGLATGGVFVMRVKGTLTSSCSSSACLITSKGLGFVGGAASFQGQSTAGPGTASTSPNINGGGGGSTGGGGGGGNAGNGGAGTSGGAGAGGTPCAGGGCLLMGGGGGAPNSGGASGNGGGVVMIFAGSIQVTNGTLGIDSSGSAGSAGSNGGGGGAGGMVQLQSAAVLNNFSVDSTGGAGGTGTNGGGGGGGGNIFFNYCSGTPPSINTVGGVAGGAAGPGGAGVNNGTVSNGGQNFCP